MQYWSDGLVATLLVIGALLAVATPIARRLPEGFPMPRAMIAGLLGWALGPSAADLLPVSRPQLESLVYHGLALVFICMLLQHTTRSRERSTDIRTVTLGIAGLAVLQGAIGLGVVIVFGGLGSELHTGFGLMAPLGFSQGPGQALALGSAWEQQGMGDGAQIGLIVASMGFVLCTLLGSAWLGLERRRRASAGPAPAARSGDESALAAAASEAAADPEGEEPPSLALAPALAPHLLVVTAVYLVTYACLRGVDALIDLAPAAEGLRATVWGFHFVVALGFAAGFRALQGRIDWLPRTQNDVLSAFASVVVEFTTCGALVAVSGAVFLRYAGPLLSLGLLSALATLLVCVVLTRRAFVREPFEHGLTLFGTATGTLLTGLTLLRVVSPNLRSDAARNQVLASAVVIPLLAPVMLGALPYLVSIHAPGSTRAALVGVGLFLAYLAVLTLLLLLNLRRSRDPGSSRRGS